MPTPPNILFIVVDELRYPMHFPQGIVSADGFMEAIMPNVYEQLWNGGVVFTRHYTAAADCSPGRGTFVTGLYAQQTNLMIVRGNSLAGQTPIEPPPLQPDFPTYGRLLMNAPVAYDTPYVGKWHLSDAPQSNDGTYLNDYGFQGQTIPDPNGVAGQGIGQAFDSSGNPLTSDKDIATQAIGWLTQRANSGTTKPFCLTVGFINPHDKQWFWNGPQGQEFAQAFTNGGLTPFSGLMEVLFGNKFPDENAKDIPGESQPNEYGYSLPPNWQSKQQMSAFGNPSLVPVFSSLTDFCVGGISDDDSETAFTTTNSPLCTGWNSVFAPYSYWTRALDMYTQAMWNVDVQIGLLLNSIPSQFKENLIIVFTSDHGEYASSHGLQGKGFSGYEETVNVPLIVRDYTGRFTKREDAKREQVTSSVDLLRMLVSFGYGDESWLTGENAQLYGGRADLLAILKDPTAPGRQFAAYTCDEILIPPALNWNNAATHVGAMMFGEGKLTLFMNWTTTNPSDATIQQMFYYDRTTPQGLRELQSGSWPGGGPDAALQMFLAEVQAPLPQSLQTAQGKALSAYTGYMKVIDDAAALAVALSHDSITATPPPPTKPVLIPTVNAP